MLKMYLTFGYTSKVIQQKIIEFKCVQVLRKYMYLPIIIVFTFGIIKVNNNFLNNTHKQHSIKIQNIFNIFPCLNIIQKSNISRVIIYNSMYQVGNMNTKLPQQVLCKKKVFPIFIIIFYFIK